MSSIIGSAFFSGITSSLTWQEAHCENSGLFAKQLPFDVGFISPNTQQQLSIEVAEKTLGIERTYYPLVLLNNNLEVDNSFLFL